MERERLAVDCLNAIEKNGLRVEVVYSPDDAFARLQSTNRSYSTYPLDPHRVAFTRTNAFWIFAMHNDEVYAGVGVRLDDLGDEPFDQYVRRTSLPTYGVPMKPQRSEPVVAPISGRAVYWGDLIAPKFSIKSLGSHRLMRLFCYYAHHRAFSDFNADVGYCYMLDKQFVRGAPQMYGFLSSSPFVWDWNDCPFDGGRPEWMSFISRTDFVSLAFSVKRLLANNRAVNDEAL